MINFAPGTKVHLACQPVDMRKGMDGLSAQVGMMMKLDPFCGHLFVFRGKRSDRVKIIYWDGTGLCLLSKRHEHGRFVWPRVLGECLELSAGQLTLLLEGIDWRGTMRVAAKVAPSLA